MASAVFPEKRTRSQLTIPDDLLLHLSQRSPLKDARTALRNHKESSPRADDETVDHSEDELLLSPSKPDHNATRTTKRSVSPPPKDEYALRPHSPLEGRELKRTKLDVGEETMLNGRPLIMSSHVLPHRFAHNRSHSQPAYGGKPTRVRSGTVFTSNNTKAPTTIEQDETSAKGKGRAQSVPLFIPSGITRIDLRNPPPSPRRPRSRSPSKEPEFRIIPAPAFVAKLSTIMDEAMNVDEDLSSTAQPVVDKRLSNQELTPTPTPTTKEKPSPRLLPIIVEPPATPNFEQPPSPPSPLTPIPETPLPSKFVKEDNRYKASGWGTIIEEEIPPLALPPSPAKPLPALVSTIKSKLPRPSSSKDLAHFGDKHPQAPPPANVPLASTSSKTSSSTSNAFAVLMANARESKGQTKIKGNDRARAATTRTISSGANTKSAAGSSKSMQLDKKVDTAKVDQATLAKTSLKSKMRPRAVQKSKPKSLLAVVPVAAESELGSLPPSHPRSPSPVQPLHPTRPPSPAVQADAPRESIVPVVEAAPVTRVTSDIVALSEPSDPVQVNGPSFASHEPAVESFDSMASTDPTVRPEPESSVDDLMAIHCDVDSNFEMSHGTGVEDNAEKVVLEPIAPEIEPPTIVESSLEPVDPPKKKPTTRKVHISKRIPTSITGPSRITRSASLKRNQMVIEVPKALPSKVSRKKTITKTSSSASFEPEMVASSSSSKLAADAPPDTERSTPTPDIPAEAVNTNSHPRMKLDSPTKKIVKTPRASFAQPTKSALAKQTSPMKPSLPKSQISSPNKLARSASMVSRPRASLSRSFTSYRNLAGSSLSTLSSALEKLQQRAPERPNTSMGFNRDDPDTSIELKSTSQDDTSVTQISASKAASSSSQGVGSSRLVQRTLFGGRPSLTGKSTIGSSSTVMRGTGSFKVPGSSLKTGNRMFGLGGSGAFSGAMRARTAQKASRKTSLPSVMASPVKGAHADDAMDIVDDHDSQAYGNSLTDLPTDALVPLNDKGKGKELATQPWESAASRRVSLASQALSQSLIASSAKPHPAIGLMGPPATPKGRKARSTSSNYPSSSSGGETSRPVTPTRTSLRLAKSTSEREGGSSGNKAAPAAPTVARPEPFKILKDCVIFVDVRNDEGEEVGSLFVEMLEGLGARILTRVGQTCTHIVFKNGLSSTINRYRLLRDPKPHVVGIAWVVDCVEQRSQVNETKFIVDLDGMNFSTNKRRRSLLPKLISHDFEEKTSSDAEGDVSMDGSTSSFGGDDDLTPLERARLRKANNAR